MGNDDPDYLTVGTYPVNDPYAALEAIAAAGDATSTEGRNGALVVQPDSAPGSVYVAFEGSDYQIEVYSPDPARALRLAKSRQLVPIG